MELALRWRRHYILTARIPKQPAYLVRKRLIHEFQMACKALKLFRIIFLPLRALQVLIITAPRLLLAAVAILNESSTSRE